MEHSRQDKTVSAACVELLVRERGKGKTLRQLGQMFGISHERVRQILAKYGQPALLPESTVAAKLGYPREWLIRLREEGTVKPVKPGHFWLYSEEQVRQIPSLIAEARKCQRCGKPRPPGSHKFCSECSPQYRKEHPYKALRAEKKTKADEMGAAQQEANPEKQTEILSRV